jgi:hypothetical protein
MVPLRSRCLPIRLQVMIGRELDDRSITAAIGAILGMPADEATKLPTA